MKFITKLVCALQHNSYSVNPILTETLPIKLPPQDTAYTLGLYPGMSSRINISTDSDGFNSFYTFDVGCTNKITFFARKDIKKGDEITTTYTSFDDGPFEKVVKMGKYGIYSTGKEVECLLELTYRGSKVEVILFDLPQTDVEDYDIQINKNIIKLCLNKNSKELSINKFKDESFVRNFLAVMSDREYNEDLPKTYCDNIDIEYSTLVQTSQSDSVLVEELVNQAKSFLFNYAANPIVNKMKYPFYYLKKYDVFAILSTHPEFITSRNIEIIDLIASWSKELLQFLSPILERSGETGKIAKRLLENAYQQSK